MNHHREILELLRQACTERNHALRLFYLATAKPGDSPGLRTLVLRGVHEPFELDFYTDRRSSKVDQLKQDSRVTALFYDPVGLLQITAMGTATLIVDPEERSDLWKRVPDWNRKDYQGALAPGTPLGSTGAWDLANLPENAAEYFQPVRIRVSALERLQLSPEGHRRFRWDRLSDTDWHGEELQP